MKKVEFGHCGKTGRQARVTVREALVAQAKGGNTRKAIEHAQRCPVFKGKIELVIKRNPERTK